MPPTDAGFDVTNSSSIGQLLHVDPSRLSPRALKWMWVAFITSIASAVTSAVSAALQWLSFGAGLSLVMTGVFAGVAIFYYVAYLRRGGERVARTRLRA